MNRGEEVTFTEVDINLEQASVRKVLLQLTENKLQAHTIHGRQVANTRGCNARGLGFWVRAMV